MYYPPTKINSESGFTLVEMAVVLVIIGLIVGGVLVGQNLIIAATERAEITQMEKFNQAVNTFYSKYGGLPGDLLNTTAAQFGLPNAGGNCHGQTGGRDGNGEIQALNNPTQPLQSGEALLFWSDLATVGLVGDAPPNTNICSGPGALTLTPGTTYIGNYLPPGKIGYGTFVQVYNNNGANWYGLNLLSSVDVGGHMNDAYPCGGPCPVTVTGIPVAMVYDIDVKIDDGLPWTGNVNINFTNTYAVVSSKGFATVNSYTGTGGGCYQNYCGMSFKLQGGN